MIILDTDARQKYFTITCDTDAEIDAVVKIARVTSRGRHMEAKCNRAEAAMLFALAAKHAAHAAPRAAAVTAPHPITACRCRSCGERNIARFTTLPLAMQLCDDCAG